MKLSSPTLPGPQASVADTTSVDSPVSVVRTRRSAGRGPPTGRLRQLYTPGIHRVGRWPVLKCELDVMSSIRRT